MYINHKRIKNLRVGIYSAGGRPAVTFDYEDYRCHAWIKSGEEWTLSDTLYCNPQDLKSRKKTREKDLLANSNKDLHRVMTLAISPESIEAAHIAFAEEAERQRIAKNAEDAAAIRDVLAKCRIFIDPEHMPHVLALRDIDDDQLISLAACMHGAPKQ